ncbi:probable phosphoglycerate mutase [Actinokineospora alba]|uniref:Probable phosphoglycerate mutase n=1 Tax=Actinokineospora alba TaxID=504798 RepID=A0A1H0WLF0_9PSEU|nr:histidine phosphatase family protein [Actinokineospora alba]TDP66249.1 putative phosphoglycerate mutase [Actinokineospora alba]SDJ43995.1 probable phosphoglycerate mutase [Actinokineospora alba]SDP91458.1 probable phosphoglycerate mutase [Actinokineospora alba]
MRLMLVRHGETPSNVRHVLDSRPPGPPLTELGRRQAEALADRLADHPVVAVYASTAIRAQETAEPVAKFHGLQVDVLDGVHEVQVGDLEGLSDPDSIRRFGEIFLRWTAGDLAAAMPGGETGQEIHDRFLKAVSLICEEHSEGMVVVATHGGVIRLIAEYLADNVGPQLANAGLIPNTGHVLLEPRESGWHCVEWTGVEI